MAPMLQLLKDCPGADVCFYSKADAVPAGVRLRQVHGICTITFSEDPSTEQEADGMATEQGGRTLLIRVADCQSFAVIAPEHGVVSGLHAGWRGLVAGAIEEHFRVLQDTWGIRPADVHVAAGPSLCQDCAEFTNPAAELPGIDTAFFRGRNADLRGIADAKLHSLGVSPAYIERHPDCTWCRSDLYWSYRAEPEAVRSGLHNYLAISKNPGM